MFPSATTAWRTRFAAVWWRCSLAKVDSRVARTCSHLTAEISQIYKWDIVGPSQHIPFQLPGFSRWQLVTNAMPTAWWFVGWGLPPTRSWNTWSWMATAWVWQPLRSWWRVCKATRPSRSSLMAMIEPLYALMLERYESYIHRYTVNTVWVDNISQPFILQLKVP